MTVDFPKGKLQTSLYAELKMHVTSLNIKFFFDSGYQIYLCMHFFPQGKISDQVYNYPEGLGEVLYREQFDFNAEPPWEPS